jgi:hypothetical protein
MSCRNKTNSFHFPVNGVGGFSLIFSEAPVVIVIVAMVSAMVFPCIVVGKVSSIEYRGIRFRVSRCQSIRVCCKDIGMVVCEFTLLLDFEMLRLNI